MSQLYKQIIEDVLTSGLFTPNEIQSELENVEYELTLDKLLKISKRFGGMI